MRVRARSIVHDHVVDEADHRSLTASKEYAVVGFDDAYYRVVDDRGEPILFPEALFEVTDPSVPDDWVRRECDDGSYYVDPPECARAGFYEDWFDGDPTTIGVFEAVLKRLTEALNGRSNRRG